MDLLKQEIPWWRSSWNEKPLQVVLFLAIGIRVLAAFFSKGYAFHDDHFESLNVAQDWVDGIGHWIGDGAPPLHSMIYAGFNAAILYLCEAVGIFDSQMKMVVIRMVHGLYSVLTVYFGYKITAHISNKTNATVVGVILALLWFMPYLSVKNLNEMVCVPLILGGMYYVIANPRQSFVYWFLAGAMFGLAFTLRIQSVLFAGGMGLGMLFNKQWKGAVYFTVGFVFCLLLFQGTVDYLFFDYPLESIVTYFVYNKENAYNYLTLPFYTYVGTLLGFLVPPVSVFLAIGFFKSRKYALGIFLGVVVFFVVHSIFPNKQERFLLPFFPAFIIMSVVGWNAWVTTSVFWQKRIRFVAGSWKFFWGLNLLVMFILALTYSKKDRIEPVYFLSQMEDVEAVVVESAGEMSKIPVFYYGQPASDYGDLYAQATGHRAFIEDGKVKEEVAIFYEYPQVKKEAALLQEIEKTGKVPNYLIMKGEKDLASRKVKMMRLLDSKEMSQLVEIEPSFYDLILHFLNPTIHAKETAYVYKLSR